MNLINQSVPAYFIMMGISDVPNFQVLIFTLVLILYLITMTGNMTIFVLVCKEPHLHTPMYFFLGNLSILDMTSTTVTLYKVLHKFVTKDDRMYFPACIAQVYMFSCLTAVELLILAAMSYDRYVAICNPLHYQMVMRQSICNYLAISCWVLGFLEVVPYVVLLSGFSCYRSNIINHFFCDIISVMKLSCSDTSSLELLIYTEGLLLLNFTPFLLTLISYIVIIETILRIQSNIGRRKAFFTCSSHLTVVVLLYGTLGCQYLKPKSMDNSESNKFFSLFNTTAVPILNPFIYSLKNKDIKLAIRQRVITRHA